MENLKCLFNCFPWDIFIFALLLGLLLWWLLSKLLGDRLKSHASELRDRISFLEGELEACRKTKVSASANLDLETCRKSDEKVKKLHKNCPKFDENMTSDLLRV